MRNSVRVRFVYNGGMNLQNKLTGRKANIASAELLRLLSMDLFAPHLPADIDFGLTHFGGRSFPFSLWLKTQKPAVFILGKYRGYSMKPEEVTALRQKAIAVGLDHKDADMNDADLSLYDFHIASSAAGLAALKRMLTERKLDRGAYLFLQSPDKRLTRQSYPVLEACCAVYIGAERHCVLPTEIEDRVQRYPVASNAEMEHIIPKLRRFNLHYAVRPDARPNGLQIYKPFTKGFNAAACHSNIIVNSDVDDVSDFLGEDYPYLVPSTRDSDILEVFQRAMDDFGGPDWGRGLDIMAALNARLSPHTLAQSFAAIIRDVAT